MQLRRHKHNLKEGLLEKSKLAQHAYEESKEVGRDEAKILKIVTAGIGNTINQPIWHA
jgi:hypothetical protein